MYESFTAFVVGELSNMKKLPQTKLDSIKYSICLYLLKKKYHSFYYFITERVCIYI